MIKTYKVRFWLCPSRSQIGWCGRNTYDVVFLVTYKKWLISVNMHFNKSKIFAMESEFLLQRVEVCSGGWNFAPEGEILLRIFSHKKKIIQDTSLRLIWCEICSRIVWKYLHLTLIFYLLNAFSFVLAGLSVSFLTKHTLGIGDGRKDLGVGYMAENLRGGLAGEEFRGRIGESLREEFGKLCGVPQFSTIPFSVMSPQ